MSTLKPISPEKPKNRLPAPSLFVGPGSRNASNTSLLTPKDRPGSSKAPLSRQASLLGDRPRLDARLDTALTPGDAGISSPLARRGQEKQLHSEQANNERTEAKWVEMQNTLEEIELSAATGAHVFGPNHSKALEDLRTAQIALAQAWARSEAVEDQNDEQDGHPGSGGAKVIADVLSSQNAEVPTGTRERSRTIDSARSQLEEETENDIAMARKRREANDRYFRNVNAGVKDVVSKLEEVAKAMKGVELESREIWGEKDSADSAASL